MTKKYRHKKRFGQHFLIDTRVISEIIDCAMPLEGVEILEIGPGDGVLTEALLSEGARVLSLEIDTTLIRNLEERFKEDENFELLCGDALKIDFIKLSKERGVKFKSVSNLPYNISGPLIAKVVEQREAFTELVLMFQREVAERVVASPGTSEYGALTVIVNAYMEAEKLLDVSPDSFKPRPKVESTVIRLIPLKEARVEVELRGVFRQVVRASFNRRRKTLSNALKVLGLEGDIIKEALIDAGIDGKRRGETLNLEEFIELSSVLSRFEELFTGSV